MKIAKIEIDGKGLERKVNFETFTFRIWQFNLKGNWRLTSVKNFPLSVYGEKTLFYTCPLLIDALDKILQMTCTGLHTNTFVIQ